MRAIVESKPIKLNVGQRVWFISLAGTKVETSVVCSADNGSSILTTIGCYLPMRMFGQKWGIA